jgi:hypothetical protein
MTVHQNNKQPLRRSLNKSLYFWSLAFALPLALTFLRKWLYETFGQFTLEQLLFHLRFGSKGLLTGDTTLAVDFLREVVIVPASYTIPIVAGVAVASRTLRDEHPLEGSQTQSQIIRRALLGTWAICVAAGIARYIYRSATSASVVNATNEWAASKLFEYIAVEPGVYTLYCAIILFAVGLATSRVPPPASISRLLSGLLTLRFLAAFSAASFLCLLNLFPLNSYLDLFSDASTQTYIDRHYETPVVEHRLQPQNLVVLYVESLEASYEQIDGGDLLDPLNFETSDWQRISDFTQVFGTGWTTAGIVASQCGLPLRPPVGSFDRANDHISVHQAILPQALCLGDLLSKEGYKNVFLNGASLDFGGLGEFIAAHGYSVARGREEWIVDGEDEISEWGLTDDRLFDRAKSEFDQLRATGQPFNLTILTLDNHGPDGILNKTCKAEGAESYAEILRCNTILVANFLKYVREQDPSVAIVVMGDHLVHKNPLLADLKALPKRNIYAKILVPSGQLISRTLVSHFDFYPTILEMAGFVPRDRRAGLGTSFLGHPPDGFINPLNSSDYDTQLQAKSALYSDLWKSR